MDQVLEDLINKASEGCNGCNLISPGDIFQGGEVIIKGPSGAFLRIKNLLVFGEILDLKEGIPEEGRDEVSDL